MNRSGAKLQGGAGLHGVNYQIVLYMLFLLKGYVRKKNFRLSSENRQAGKFDDLVFQDDHETILLQAKHKTNINKKISSDQLFSTTGEFSLRKYFDSFLEIYSRFPNASYVICTNIDVNNEVSDKYTKRHEMEKGSVFFNYRKTEVKQYFYSFNTEELIYKFKEENREKEFKNFLNNLQLVVFADDDVEQINMKILESVVNFDKRLKIDFVYNFFYKKLKTWFEETKLRYLTKLDLESYLSEMLSTLFLKNLQKHEDEVKFSDLPLTSNKQTIIIETTRYLLVMLKLFIQFSDDKKENTLFVDPHSGTYQETMINVFQLKHFTKLICPVIGVNKTTVITAIEKLMQNVATKDYKQIFILTADSLPPNFYQNAHIISDKDILKDIKLNNNSKEIPIELEEVYTKRYLVCAKFGINTEEEFLKKTLNDNCKIFLLSDIAGMGKTTTLSYLANILKKTYKNLWVKKFNLSSYTGLFYNCLKRKKPLDLDALLNFQDPIEEFEQQIISIQGMLILMLDSLDEVSYDQIELILRFIKDNGSCLNIKKIFITARPQIEDLISKNLEVEIFSLKPLVKTEQYHMIFEYWIRNLDVTDEEKKKKCLEYGEKLLKSLSSLLLNLNKLIGIPLVVKMLSEIYEPQAKKYCLALEENETNKLFDHFNLAMLYDKFIDRKKEIYVEEKNQAIKAACVTFDRCLTECTSLALRLNFPKEICAFFEESLPSGTVDPNSLCDTGIVTFSNGAYKFLHRTFAEYLVAQRLFAEVANSQETRVRVLVNIFFIRGNRRRGRGYNGIYWFFNSILKNEENNIEPKMYEIWGKAIEDLCSRNLDFILIPWEFVDIMHLLFDKCIVAKTVFTNYKHLNGEPLLHFVARSGLIDIVRYLIEVGVDVDIKNRRGETALHTAVGISRLSEEKTTPRTIHVVKYLVEEGANVNAKDDEGISILHKAASSNNWWAINYLIKKGADVNVLDNDGRSILHYPLFFTRIDNMNTISHSYVKENFEVDLKEYIEFLVNKGANINAKDKNNNSVLHTALLKSRLQVRYLSNSGVKFMRKHYSNITAVSKFLEKMYANRAILSVLIEKDAEINAIGKTGKSVLHAAAWSGDVDIVRSLVEKGANINSVDENGESVLYCAAKFREREIVYYLIGEGADINAITNSKQTVLHAAVWSGNVEMVRFLVEKGANVNAVNKNGESVLYYAAHCRNKEIVYYLIGEGADINAITNSKETVLHAVVQSGNVDMVRILVEKGADINAINNRKHSVLHVAARSGDVDIVRSLVEKGANINSVDENRESVLYYAAKFREREIVYYLIGEGADINAITNSKETVLHAVVQSGNVDMVRILVEKGADINAINNRKHSVLHVAARSGDVDIVRSLVEKGANINSVDENGESVLYCAAKFREREIVYYLIGEGADINAITNSKETVLHAVVRSGNVDMVRILVEKGADINAINNRKDSVLHAAARSGDVDIVRSLVEKGANINSVDENRESVLYYAAKFREREIVYYLIGEGADINAITNSKETVLHAVVRSGTVDMVRILVEKGANVNAVDQYGGSVLFQSIIFGNREVVDYLIEKGADINAITNSKQTVLHAAVWSGNVEMVRFLVEKGANVNAVNKNGESVLYYAAHCRNKEIVYYLIGEGADINAINNRKHSVLHVAARSGHVDIVRSLVEKGADINAITNSKQTVLHAAVLSGNVEMVRFLVEKGANVNAVDTDGKSVLYYAIKSGYREIVCYLLKKGADVNAVSNSKESLLDLANSSGNEDIVRSLVENGANVNDVYST